MVKFSKELEAQLIPEWREAFANYWQLKKHIKKIKLSRSSKQTPGSNRDFGLSVLDSLRFSVNKISRLSPFHRGDVKPDVIVHQKRNRNVEEGSSEEEAPGGQSELSQLFSEEDEVKVFFERLEEEVEKVDQFYERKEDELLDRGEILNKQLQVLLEAKQILIDGRRKSFSSGVLSCSCSSSGRSSYFSSESGQGFNESPADKLPGTEDDVSKNGAPKTWMKMDIPATTPTRTVTAVTSLLWEDILNRNPKDKKEAPGNVFNRNKIQCAEKMIRAAFIELYRGLGLLRTYSSLNMIAFTKILKKFDKVANQKVSMKYLKMVKISHFISSDKALRLMDEVESIFTKHFANNDRKRAMRFLRPQQHKDSHVVTFFVGLFTGCFVTLFIIYAILAHFSEVFSPRKETAYVEIVYPVFSMFSLLSLHMFMYGCDLFMWRTTRINYNFIFEFSPSTALKYRDAFLICTSIMTSVVGALVIHLIFRSSGFSPSQVDLIPGFLLLFFVGLLVCPFNIFYRPTRYCFIRVIRNIVSSPLYKVMMADFFMADQFTSQIPLLRHMESTACYFVAGSFKTHQFGTCKSGRLYRELAYVISFLPYYWRAMQCARRFFDERDLDHLANMGKYISAMVAAGARLRYANQENHLWLSIVLFTSVVATLYQLYWDFVKDWGFLKPESRNLWLRDDLILKHKSIYYFSIFLNVVLRVAWVETVLRFRVGIVQSRMLDFFLASLEVIRRGHWNFYRLENEHLNNIGKFRAVKTVPLPFREMDSDG